MSVALGEDSESSLTDPFARLSPTEQIVARHVAAGLTAKNIAGLMDISADGVRFHLARIAAKLAIDPALNREVAIARTVWMRANLPALPSPKTRVSGVSRDSRGVDLGTVGRSESAASLPPGASPCATAPTIQAKRSRA